MAPNATFTELVTTTARNRKREVRDNVSNSIALFKRLSEKGNVDYYDGGRTIVEELDYRENPSGIWYEGWEQLNTSRQDVLSAAEFEPKQLAVSIQISGREMLMNRGKYQMVRLLKARMTNADRTLKNMLGEGCYSAGTNAKQIGGLQLLVPTTATNTVGGISRSAWTFWANQERSCLTDGGAAASAANITSNMNAAYISACRGNEHPDFGIADNNFYRYYLESLQPQQQISNSKLADAGFMNLKYMGMDIVLDGGHGGNCPSNTMYMLNTNYLKLRPHPDCEFDPLGSDREPTNQHGVVQFLGWMGNLTISNSFLQVVLAA